MKLNELICPGCGLKCLVDSAYTSCDGCGAHYTAAQSRSRDNPAPYPTPNVITTPIIQIDPNVVQIQPPIQWVNPIPNDPYVTGPGLIDGSGTICSTGQDGVTYEVWN